MADWRHHWLVIVSAMAIGIIVGLPHILIPGIIAPKKYDSLQFNPEGGSAITMEEVYTYVPEVKEILGGKFLVTDTQVAEYSGKTTPFVGETGLAWIMAGLAKLVGSIQNAFVVADFIFPSITFLLVYMIMWLFTKSQVVSTAIGMVLVIWPELSILFPYPNALTLAVRAAFDPPDFLFISRNFHPQLSLPAYLGAFLLVLIALKRQKIWSSVLTGVMTGFLFYTYIFNWTAFIFGLFIFLISVFYMKFRKRGSWDLYDQYLKHLSIIFAIAIILSIPYFMFVWQFRQSGVSQDFFTKLSLQKRGFFDLIARQIIFLISLIWLSRKKMSTEKILFVSFWLAPLLLPDVAQNILGRDLEGKHWVRRIAYPFGVMSLGMIAFGMLNRKLMKLLCLSLIILVLAYGLVRQTRISFKIAEAYAQDPDKQELYDWINKNIPSGSVIASLGWDTVVNIPARTHAFNLSPIGMRTIASTNESIDRFLWTAALYKAPIAYIQQAFSENGEGTTRTFYFTLADGAEVFSIPPELTQTIMRRYQTIEESSKEFPYKLDYILVGETERKILKQDEEMLGSEIVFSNRHYSLLRYTH